MEETDKTIQRGNCFKLLAACFYEPDKQLFLKEELCEKLELVLQGVSPEGEAAARKMQSFLKVLDQEELSIDHAVLFIGPFELTAAPYGSVYIEKKRTVMGESTVNVAGYYQEAGLSVDVKEVPDHIAIELEFMHYLCIKEAAAARDNQIQDAQQLREQQRVFYFNALKPWTREFCEAMRAGTENGFYRNLADCLEYFLDCCEQLYNEQYAA